MHRWTWLAGTGRRHAHRRTSLAGTGQRQAHRWTSLAATGRPETHRRMWLAGTVTGAAAVLCVTSVTACAAPPPRLLLGGITAQRSAPDGIRVLPPGPSSRDDSVSQRGSASAAGPASAARTASPAGLALPSLAGPPHSAAQRWLAAGSVPGRTPAQRQLAEGALIDLRLLTRSDGAVAAAWFGPWKFAWPRDSSWVAAAFAATGHSGDALRVLRFLARVQGPAGTWAAKYTLAGGPAPAGPGAELDANGWFPWAVWIWYSEQGGRAGARRELPALWPAVRRAADATAASLSAGGLPPPSPDYWEQPVSQPTIGTAGPLLAGLRAAARLAASLGDVSDERRWASSAARLDRGIQAAFGPEFNRFPNSAGGAGTWLALFGTGPGPARDGLSADSVLNGPDAAVTFLGPPFGPASAAVSAAVARAARVLTLPDGGILPGTTWRGDRTVAWTPATGFFALYDAATGQRAAAAGWLDWLAAHRTADGALPEQVNASGQPVSVAPLGWTCAIVLLAITAMRHPLPVP